MSFSSRKPKRFQSGGLKEQLTLTNLNLILDLLSRQTMGDGRVLVTHFGDRTVLSGEDRPKGYPVQDEYFSIISEHDDYLLCSPYFFASDNAWVPPHKYNINSGPLGPLPSVNQRVYVAKPYLLQKTPWHQQPVIVGGISITYNYTGFGRRDASGVVNGDPVVEDQYITPPYIQGEIIVCRNMLTAVRYPGAPLPGAESGSPEAGDPDVPNVITWVDTNEAGRCWAVDCATE